MSGIVGIVNLDGAPIDGVVLGRMTTFMAFRGPDAQRMWLEGRVGFGHTLMKTTHESARERQPFSFDAATWIVADARIDARPELIDQLRAEGQSPEPQAPDVELILRAYRAWGSACVEHLLGDFAFGIWDAPRQRLFCARDHLGVKSFFFSHVGRTVIFSNTLDCVRLHPCISDALNDLAVADFLLFELNQDPTTTVFKDVARLPPGHIAMWSAEGSVVKRYWSLPIEEPVFYRRHDDYVDRFNATIEAAVSDRLRIDRVGVFMSGGLDSPTLAAVASQVFGRRGEANGVRAFTRTVRGLDGDEGRYARLVAEDLGIPISHSEGGDAAFDPGWDTRVIHTPAPVRDVLSLTADRQLYEEASGHSRVCFYGEGPDNALQYEWQPYLRYLTATHRYGRLVGDVVRHVRRHRRLPLMSIVPRLMRARRDRGRWDWSYPPWLEPAFERRLQLRQRWHQYQGLPEPPAPHPVRPGAYASFCGNEWEALFRGFDAEETGCQFEVRHPFLDLRVVEYLLRVPVVPWCRSKFLIREAMRDKLPAAVLRRRKTPLSGDPDFRAARRVGLPELVPAASLRAYVDPARIPDVGSSDMIAFRGDFRPRALNFWLTNLQSGPNRVIEVHDDEVAHV